MSGRRPISHPPADSGQAALELALCLPLFALLVLGTAEVGNLAWTSVQINNAARAGAQFAAASRANAADIPDIEAAARAEAPGLTLSFNPSPTQTCSCVGSDGSSTTLTCDSNALSNCPSPSTIQVAVQVNVQAAVTPFVRYPGLPGSYTVNAQATMGVGQ